MNNKKPKAKLSFKKKPNSKSLNFKSKQKAFIDPSEVSYDLDKNLDHFLGEHLATESVAKIESKFHELEFRMGKFRGNRFDAYMPRLQFNRIIQHYHQKYSDNLVENISLDIIYDENYRVTISGQTLNNSKNEIEYFCKTNRMRDDQVDYYEKVQVAKSDNKDWSYRLTSAHESEIKNQTERMKIKNGVEDKTASKFYRYKYRYSFQINDQVRLDCTIVKETPPGVRAGTLIKSRTLAQKEKYQIEMEYTGQNFKKDNLAKLLLIPLNELSSLYMGIKGSKRSISQSHTDLVLSKYLSLALDRDQISLKDIHQGSSSKKFLAINVEALTRQNFNLIREDYMVTLKADGEHYLLYYHPELGFYLINNRLEVSPVNENNMEKFANMGQCLFDGELVEYQGKWRFLIFDCFFYGDEDRRDLNLFSKDKGKYVINEKCRMFYIKKFVAQVQTDLLSDDLVIESKDYFPVDKVSRFFKSNENNQFELKDDTPYFIDGLVFTPVSEPYPKVAYSSGRFVKKESVDHENIMPMLKWKPPQFLSIDFRVNFGQQKKIQKINGKDYLEVTLESVYGSQIHPFEPSSYRVKDYNKAYLELTKGQPQLIEREGYRVEEETLGHVIRNRDILEFVWIPDRSFGDDYWGIWFPIKYREDKTAAGFPNNYRKVADPTWMAIMDRQILPENLMDPSGRVRPTPQLDMGYYQNRNRDQLMNLRGIHNSVKTIMIFLAVKQAGGQSQRLMDLATGRAGDLFKWNGVNYVFGVEFNEGNLKSGADSAYGRYRDRIESSLRNDRKPSFILDLIQGNMGDLFSEYRASDEAVMNYIMKERLERNKESFGVISCQFAIHYICDTEEHIDNFFRNVSENLATNGYFIATTFDGEKILNALKNTDLKDNNNQPLLMGKDGQDNIMWSISSAGKYTKLENAGQRIFVFNKTIKDEEEMEYLVNFNYLMSVAQKYDLYPAQLSFGRHTMPSNGYGVGDFSDLYEDDYMNLIGQTIYPKGSPKFKSLEKNFNNIPRDIKRYSKYSSYLVLSKR